MPYAHLRELEENKRHVNISKNVPKLPQHSRQRKHFYNSSAILINPLPFLKVDVIQTGVLKLQGNMLPGAWP